MNGKGTPALTMARPGIAEPAEWPATFAVFAAAAFALLAFQMYLQNVNIATTNGLWKSIDVKRWIATPSWQRVDFANVLYFPVQALWCLLLEHLGIFRGQIWRQLAVLNGLAGGIGAAAVYLFTLRWQGRHTVALLTTFAYCGTGFYLLLSVIDEDIMPGAVLVLIATLLGAGWFPRPTRARIAVVAVIFCIGWLWEWRLIFPSLPAMLLALFVARGTWFERFWRPAWFLLAMAAVPMLIAVVFRLLRVGGVKGAALFFVNLFWAGKGVGSGWGGFSWAKVVLGWMGACESVVGAANIGSWDAWRSSPVSFHASAGSAILLLLAVVAAGYAWRRHDEPSVRVGTALFGGTLLAGTVFNLYSQPQDPQMVINVMLWTIPACGILARCIAASRATAVLALAMLFPLAYNVDALAAQRGQDRVWAGLASGLATRFDPAQTVYLYQGFEGIMTWQAVMLGNDYIYPETLPPAAHAKPSFKHIDAMTPRIENPQYSAQQVAEAIRRNIDAALDRGYQVVAAPEFVASDDVWINGFATVATPDVPKAVRAMIAEHYQLTPAYNGPPEGEYSLLTRRTAP